MPPMTHRLPMPTLSPEASKALSAGPWRVWHFNRIPVRDAAGSLAFEAVCFDFDGEPIKWLLVVPGDPQPRPVLGGFGFPPWNPNKLDPATLALMKSVQTVGGVVSPEDPASAARGKAVADWLLRYGLIGLAQ